MGCLLLLLYCDRESAIDMLRGPATGMSLCDEHPYHTTLLIRQILDPIFDDNDHDCKETQRLMQNFSHPRSNWEVDIGATWGCADSLFQSRAAATVRSRCYPTYGLSINRSLPTLCKSPLKASTLLSDHTMKCARTNPISSNHLFSFHSAFWSYVTLRTM